MMANAPEVITPRINAPSSPAIDEVRRWVESIDPDPEHAIQVTRLAVALFDGLAPLHGFGARERDILEAGALVHDIGMCVSNKKHHKHSFQMVKNHSFRRWRPEDVEMFALVGRYHRKAEPSMNHNEYAALPEKDRDVVRKLTALLRLADGLDRAHLATVRDMAIECDSSNVRITLHAYRDCGTEIWGAGRKADLFERVFSRGLVIQPADAYRSQT